MRTHLSFLYHYCRERPKQTAAREGSEESLEVVGSENNLKEMLGHFKENNVFKVSTSACKNGECY